MDRARDSDGKRERYFFSSRFFALQKRIPKKKNFKKILFYFSKVLTIIGDGDKISLIYKCGSCEWERSHKKFHILCTTL